MTSTESTRRAAIVPANDDGIAILLVAILLLSILTLVALAMDGGGLMQRKKSLRAALDAAANRGMLQLRDGETDLARVRNTILALVRTNLSTAGIDPDDLVDLSTTFSADNTRVDLEAHLKSAFRFAEAVPGLGKEQTIFESSAAEYHKFDPPPPAPEEAHIVAVVDTSCSMWFPHTQRSSYRRRNGTNASGRMKIHAVMSALQRLIIETKNGRYLSIVTFDTVGITRLRPMKISDDVEAGQRLTNRQRAMGVTYDLDQRHTRCSTRTADGMLEGLVDVKRMLAEPDVASPDRVKVLLVTDGGATHEITAARPPLGYATANQAIRGVDSSTYGACNLGNRLVRGTAATVKVAEMIRHEGVAVHVLGVGRMNSFLKQGLELVAGMSGTSGMIPCRLFPQPFVISASELSPPPGIFIAAVKDLGAIFSELAAARGAALGDMPRLVHPIENYPSNGAEKASG